METISDLAKRITTAGCPHGHDGEFRSVRDRPDRFGEGLRIRNRPGQYQADGFVSPITLSANGDLDTIAAQATDGQIAALGLKTLKDDKGFFPNMR